MSAIASFYKIRHEDAGDLINAAKAQSIALTKKRWGIFRPKLPLNPDPFWDYIDKNTQELDQYPYSGFLLLDVETLASGIFSSNEETGRILSDITKATFVSYDQAEAKRALDLLNNASISDTTIKLFLIEAGRAEEYPEIVAPILNSVVILKKWLGAVTDSHLGVLSIG